MTQQRSSRKLTLGLFFTAALLLAIGLPLRIYQQLRLVEDTGFWSRFEPTQIMLYALLALLVLLPSCLAYAARQKTVLVLGRRRRVWEGVAAIVVAVTLAVDVISAARFAIDLMQNAIDLMQNTPKAFASGTPMQLILRSGILAAILETLFAACGAVFFINLAMVDWFPRKKVYLSRLLALTPLFWCISRILRRFARTISYLRVSDLFLSLCMLVVLMLFFLPFAQLLSGINHERRAHRLAASGISAAVLSLLCFVPRMIASANGVTLSQDASIELCDLAIAVFIFLFLAGRLFTVTRPLNESTAKESTDEKQVNEAAANYLSEAGMNTPLAAAAPQEPPQVQV